MREGNGNRLVAMDLEYLTDRGRRVGAAVLIGLVSFVCGAILTKAGAMFGPVLMVAAPLGLLVAAATLTRPLIGVIAVYLSFPVAFQALPLGSLDIKVVEAAAAMVTGLVILRRLATGATPLPWVPAMWWAFLLVGTALAATPSAIAQSEATKQDAFLVVGFLYALAVLAAVRNMEDVRSAIGWLLAVGTGLCAWSLQDAADLAAQFGGTVGTGRIQGTFGQPNDLGAFSAMILMLSIGMVVASRSRWSRLGGWVSGLVSLAALVLSLSRGAWIGTLLGLTVMIVAVPQVRGAAFAVVLPFLLIVSAALAVFLPSAPPQVEVVTERLGTLATGNIGPYDARPDIWREAVREIKEDPWTGLGPGNFPVASTRSQSLAVSVNASHAHDVLLTVGAEAGLPSVFLVIGFTLALVGVARRAIRCLPDTGDRAIIAGVGAAMACQIGQGLVDYNLRNPLIFILMWSFVGLLLVGGRLGLEAEERSAESRRLVYGA